MKQSCTPYKVHLFVCTNDRGGIRDACADKNSAALREKLKEEVAQRGLKPTVRVSASGCLGLCACGPNIMAYPQGMVFSSVKLEDLDHILEQVVQWLETDA